MATVQAAPRTGAFSYLELGQIGTSSENPRRRFDADALAELTASIRESGVQQPITVRPHPQASDDGFQFEIVSGVRRYLAAQPAGLTEIPCYIRELPDPDGAADAVTPGKWHHSSTNSWSTRARRLGSKKTDLDLYCRYDVESLFKIAKRCA